MASKYICVCGVCDKVMMERTPAIACISCCHWIHLKPCANLTYKMATKLKGTYHCSKCNKLDGKVHDVSYIAFIILC